MHSELNFSTYTVFRTGENMKIAVFALMAYIEIKLIYDRIDFLH